MSRFVEGVSDPRASLSASRFLCALRASIRARSEDSRAKRDRREGSSEDVEVWGEDVDEEEEVGTGW